MSLTMTSNLWLGGRAPEGALAQSTWDRILDHCGPGRYVLSDRWQFGHPQSYGTQEITSRKQHILSLHELVPPQLSYCYLPEAQRVSPPMVGTVSLCRWLQPHVSFYLHMSSSPLDTHVTPAGCRSCTRSVCQRDAPPGMRKLAGLSVACKAGQMTETPGTPGTCGTCG